MLLSPSPVRKRAENLELQTVRYRVQKSACVCTTERVSQALRKTSHWAFRGIEVSVQNEVVLIEGQVASYYQKQLAQESVRKIIPDAQIRNEVNVVRRPAEELRS